VVVALNAVPHPFDLHEAVSFAEARAILEEPSVIQFMRVACPGGWRSAGWWS
jgi:hypothetical protein